MEDYLQCSFQELHRDDGLLVLGKGLGLEALCGKFLRLYAEQPLNRRRDLVLCINAGGKERSIRTAIISDGGMPDMLPKIINNEVTSQERTEMYAGGGCFFITTRILIVDLLDGTLDPLRISGLLIYDAHRISETSIESFVIRVFRDNNRSGFIKAFSEEPEMMQGGFGRIERIMRTLYVKKLHLWPRFRLEIAQSIEGRPQPEVIEIKMQLTANMRAIQNAILVCLNTCLTELKKACPTLDGEIMTLENGLFASFDHTIRHHLDPEWHRISFRVKALISDMGVLRKLLDYLIRYDAFSFYYLLLKLHATSSAQTTPALWLTTDAANMIFQHAKARVHQVQPKAKAKVFFSQNPRVFQAMKQVTTQLHMDSVLSPVLECPPKWNALMQIMKEIREDFLIQRGSAAGSGRETTATARSAMPLNAGRVLLIARDELAASQLRDCLIHGTKYVMDGRYRWFVSQQCAEVRRKSHRSSRSTGGSGRTGRPGAPASAAAATAPPGYTTGPNQDKDAAQELFSERNVSGLLQQGGEAAAGAATAAPEEANDAKGGFCDLGLSEVDVKRLPPETQMLLLQERVLKLSPPVASQRHGGWSLRQVATAADDDDVAAVSGVKREAISTEEVAAKRRKLVEEEAAAVPLEHVDNVIDLADIDDDDGGGGSGALAADRPMDDDGSNDDDDGPHASASAKKSRASLGPSSSISRTGASRSAAAKPSASDRKRPAVAPTERSDDAELIDLDEDNDGTRSHRPPQAARFVDTSDELIVHVTTHHQLRESWSLLRDVQPASVVLYDADVRIIRQIEAFQSSMAVTQPPVRVYFLAYEGSAEEHRYVAALAKEKTAFESLIMTKEHLVVSLPDNPFDIQAALQVDASLTMDSRALAHHHDGASSSSASAMSGLPIGTSMAASTMLPLPPSKRKKIVVDVREFRSTLPSLLHVTQQWQVVPRTLYIGDYVLAPEICVERKGISDLFQSFASGRLYNQAEAMSRYYRHPCLLIEFQPDKPFCLTTTGDLGADISPNSIVSKLVLLAQSFPHLRILWSRSPQQTVAIFKTIAAKHDEADIDKAVTVGSALENIDGPGDEPIANSSSTTALPDARLTAQEMLLSLPGINVHNFRDVMHHVRDLATLTTLTEAQLTPLVGPGNAKKLRAFFTQRS